jgi:hypothetical protein
MNYVLDYLSRQGPVSVDDYVSLNWPGMTFQELEGEDRVEVEDLIESGDLKLETVGTRSIQ